MTNPTTTAQATVLTEEQLQHAIETVHDFGDNIMIDHYFGMIVAHIDALTEQVRVLRPVVEWYADEANYNDHHQLGVTAEFSAGKGLVQVVWIPDDGKRARRALAALEGEVGE